MKFSQKFLDSISYYRQYNIQGAFGGYSTIVEVHFISWFKFKKKFKFPWACQGMDDNGMMDYRKPTVQIDEFISKLEGN